MTAGRVDHAFIRRLEGFRRDGYVPSANGRPLGQSGVTVGAGVDLGHWTAEQLRRRGTPEHVIDAVAPYLGLRGAAAVAALAQRPLRLSYEDAAALTGQIGEQILHAVASRYDRAAKATGSLRWSVLPEPCRTVVASVAYQYGPALSARTPNFWRQVTAGQWGAAVANLEAFGDAYPTRRNAEAAHLRVVLP